MVEKNEIKNASDEKVNRGNLKPSLENLEFDIVDYVIAEDLFAIDSILGNDAAKVNFRRNGTGLTPLMAASGCGLVEVVGYLMSQPGIDIYAVDGSGRSALDHGRLFPEVMRVLLYPENRTPDVTVGPKFRLD